MLDQKLLNEYEVTDEQYTKLKEMLHKQVGMVFTPRLDAWVKKQVVDVFKASEGIDFDNFITRLINSPGTEEAQKTFESLTVHETMFYRDKKYFKFLREVAFPQLIEQNKAKRELNLWIAAGSSGQEAYSILFTLADEFPEVFNSWTINFYSTDLSHQIVAKADLGIYEIHEMNRGMEDEFKRQRFFAQQCPKTWQVKDNLRKMLTFRQGNLVESFATLPNFDFISCRNVLIYFSDNVKADIINRLGKKVNPGGFLLLGQVDLINGTVPDACEQKIQDLFPYLVKEQ